MEISLAMRIGLTGSTGLLGSTFLALAKKGPHAVISYRSNLKERESLRAEICQSEPSWIIHTAAKTDVAACEREPDDARAINVEGTKHMVEAARAVGARLIYISTVSIFSGYVGNYTESDVPSPANVYNTTKYEAEQLVRAYENGMVIRLNLIGIHPKGSRGRNFVEWVVDSARLNKDMSLFIDQLINPLSNWTIAQTLFSIIEKDMHEPILHLGSRDVLSKAAIARLVLERFPNYAGTVTETSIDSIADGVIRPKQMWLNTEKGESLGFLAPTLAEELDLIFKNQLLGGFDH